MLDLTPEQEASLRISCELASGIAADAVRSKRWADAAETYTCIAALVRGVVEGRNDLIASALQYIQSQTETEIRDLQR